MIKSFVQIHISKNMCGQMSLLNNIYNLYAITVIAYTLYIITYNIYIYIYIYIHF